MRWSASFHIGSERVWNSSSCCSPGAACLPWGRISVGHGGRSGVQGPAEQRAQPAYLCAKVFVCFAARHYQHPRYNLGVHCTNWQFARKLAPQPVVPKATWEAVVCEKCTWVHFYFTNLYSSELMVDLLQYLQVVRATPSLANVGQSRCKGLCV